MTRRVDLRAAVREYHVTRGCDANVARRRAHGHGRWRIATRGRPADHEGGVHGLGLRGQHVGAGQVGTGHEPQAARPAAHGDCVVKRRSRQARRRLEARTQAMVDHQPARRAQGDARLCGMRHGLHGGLVEQRQVPVHRQSHVALGLQLGTRAHPQTRLQCGLQAADAQRDGLCVGLQKGATFRVDERGAELARHGGWRRRRRRRR